MKCFRLNNSTIAVAQSYCDTFSTIVRYCNNSPPPNPIFTTMLIYATYTFGWTQQNSMWAEIPAYQDSQATGLLCVLEMLWTAAAGYTRGRQWRTQMSWPKASVDTACTWLQGRPDAPHAATWLLAHTIMHQCTIYSKTPTAFVNKWKSNTAKHVLVCGLIYPRLSQTKGEFT